MAFEDCTNRSQLPLYAGTPCVFTLPPGGKLLRGEVIISGNVVISGGTTSGTAVGDGGPVNLISWIKVTANRAAGSRYPGGRIVDCDPRSLLRQSIPETQGKYLAEQSGSTLGNGAAGTYPIYLSIPIYFADAALLNEITTGLNMDLVDSTGAPIYSSVQVEVDIAASLATIFAGSDRALNLSGLTCQWVDDRLALTTDTTPVVQETHVAQIGAANHRMQDYGLPQDGSYTKWIIMAEQGSSQALADTLLNRLTIISPTLSMDLYAQDIRQRMYRDGWYDPSTTATGLFDIDFTHGLLQNSNAAAGINLRLDVNNPSGANLDQLRFYTRRVFSLLS